MHKLTLRAGLVLVVLLAAAALVAQNVAIYTDQGGAGFHIGSGGTQTVESGGALNVASGGSLKIAGTTVTSSAAELNAVDGVTSTAAEITANTDGVGSTLSFSAAAGAANVSEVTVTVKDGAGGTVAAVHNFDLWLSDASTCAGLTGTTTSGAVAAKAASGVDLSTYTAKKAIRIQTLATGVYILSITDTAKTGFYVCGLAPATGKAVASSQLVTGSYG